MQVYIDWPMWYDIVIEIYMNVSMYDKIYEQTIVAHNSDINNDHNII